jgi:hypothetical protein
MHIFTLKNLLGIKRQQEQATPAVNSRQQEEAARGGCQRPLCDG